MPTVLREDGYRYYFYSRENDEPAHIHVEHGDRLAKFWLTPVSLASSKRFRMHELSDLRQRVIRHRRLFLEAWEAHFDQ